MEIDFSDDNLQKLYEGEKISDKKYRYDSNLIKQYRKTIEKLNGIETLEDLFLHHALCYKKLQGTEKSAVRINEKYRLLFQEETENKHSSKVIRFLIQEISNHYE
jgi:plasmid maintenance system killer protein